LSISVKSADRLGVYAIYVQGNVSYYEKDDVFVNVFIDGTSLPSELMTKVLINPGPLTYMNITGHDQAKRMLGNLP